MSKSRPLFTCLALLNSILNLGAEQLSQVEIGGAELSTALELSSVAAAATPVTLADYLAELRSSLPDEPLTLRVSDDSSLTVTLSADELVALVARDIVVQQLPEITQRVSQATRALDLKTGVTWIAASTVIGGVALTKLYQNYRADQLTGGKAWSIVWKALAAELAMDGAVSVWSLHERQRIYVQKEQQVAQRLWEAGIDPHQAARAQRKIEQTILITERRLGHLQRILEFVGFGKLRLYWEDK